MSALTLRERLALLVFDSIRRTRDEQLEELRYKVAEMRASIAPGKPQNGLGE